MVFNKEMMERNRKKEVFVIFFKKIIKINAKLIEKYQKMLVDH